MQQREGRDAFEFTLISTLIACAHNNAHTERQISSCSIPLLGCSASVNEAAPSAEEAARVQV